VINRRYAYLDADGPPDEDGWFGVVIRAETGVVYVQQYGGHACRQGEVEGYYVPVTVWNPVSDRHPLRELRQVFEAELGGRGLPPGSVRESPDLLQRLRSTVGSIGFLPSSNSAKAPDTLRRHLELDAERLDELDEAWIPVRTADGPGILLWPNSD
jgi:Family of unknown function (DUF6210)